jgi:hypothetical protein
MWLPVAACAASTLAAAAPWATSGSTERSGYRLMGVAASLRVDPTWAVRGILVALALLPAATAGAWLAASLRRARLVGTLAVATGLVAAVGGGAVLWSPLRPAWGAGSSVVVGAVTAAVGVRALARNGGDGHG